MARTRTAGTSIAPFEIVFPGTHLDVTLDEVWDPRDAQSNVVVDGVRGRVQLLTGRRTARWIPLDRLVPGAHTLRVNGEVTPFFLTDSTARIPPAVRIYALNRVRVHAQHVERLPSGDRPRGAFYEFMKGVHRRTGAPVSLAFDRNGTRVDGAAITARIELAQARAYGKRNPSLDAAVRSGSRHLPVAIWLHCEQALALERRPRRGAPMKTNAQVRRRQAAVATYTREFLSEMADSRLGRDAHADRLAPVIYATLTPPEIKRLERDHRVVGLFLADPRGRVDLTASVAIARADKAHADGARGTGVNVAVWEEGPDLEDQLTITDRYTSSPNTGDHSRLTHAIIRNRQRNGSRGHAPGCNLFSANSYDREALAWAVEQGCTVISQSFHRRDDAGSSTLGSDDIYKDWLAIHMPYPTICQAAGNFYEGDDDDIDPPEDEFVNHKGFNGLVVANHDDTATVISGGSVFRNCASRHGDRELPHVSANGIDVTAVGLTNSGTSFAAPAVAGGVALIQSVNSSLPYWPEACRAIIMAAATRKNISGSSWWRDVQSGVDASDGAGAHDAQEACRIARQPRNRNAAPSRRGWDAGLLRSAELTDSNRMSTFSYKIRTPAWGILPKVKVVLTWHSQIQILRIAYPGAPLNPLIRLASVLTVDLDLFVLDEAGVPVGVSASQDNSCEIVEFTARRNATYEIRIQRFAGTDEIYYGIAWTVFDDTFLDPDGSSVSQS